MSHSPLLPALSKEDAPEAMALRGGSREREGGRERELRDYHLPIRALVLVRQRPSAKRGRYRLEKCTLSYFTQERTLCKLLRSSLRDDIMATMEQRWRVYVCVRGCGRRKGGRERYAPDARRAHTHTYTRMIRTSSRCRRRLHPNTRVARVSSKGFSYASLLPRLTKDI